MGKITEYLTRSVKIAWKTVFLGFRQYLCFFIAMLIIQTMFGTVSVSNDNNSGVEYAAVTAEYDYEVRFGNLNYDQMRTLSDDSLSKYKSDRIYEIVRIDEYRNMVADEMRYDVYLNFIKSKEFSLSRLESKYIPEIDKYKTHEYVYETSPLLEFEDSVRNNAISFFFISLVLLALCIFLLNSLYNIRLNQYKFQYGVYLTFGADFKMLFGTAFWEMFIIMVVTFIPSVAISTLVSFLIFNAPGVTFVFSGWTILKVFVFSLIVIVAAIWAPMKLMSRKDPMKLIITEDNSNLVTSPRSSLSIFGEKFPTRYEIYSMWRFRKYNIRLLATAIVFCAVFIMGLYMADIYRTDLEYPRAQFTVSFKGSGFTYDSSFSEELYAIDGVRAVEISDNSTEALELGSHVVFRSSSALPLSGVLGYTGSLKSGEKLSTSNTFVYTAMNAEQLRLLEDYTYSGDLNCINEPGYVIMGDSESNVRKYTYNVGDTIYVAVKTSQIRAVDPKKSGNSLLSDQLKYFRFEYREYTIGAVIYDVPCGSTPVFMNYDDYVSVTGSEPSAMTLNVYAEKDMTPGETNALYAKISDWAHYYGNVTVKNEDAALTKSIAKDKHYNELYVMASLLILCISPLVWFFSQALYYRKRENEFNILQAMGAVAGNIRAIYLQGGFTMAGFSLIVSVALSYLGSYLLFFLYNVVMPNLTGENVRYVFYMPWYAIVTSVVMSVACGFLSAYFPYRSYFRHRYSLRNGGAGNEYGDE